MKRTIFILLLISAVMLAFSACGMRKPRIEDYEWKMRTIMHTEDSQIIYDATDEEITTHKQAKLIDMTLVAKDGKITINDYTNGKTYGGTYTVSGKNPKGTDYHITIDGKAGFAGVAMTTYADGTKEATLPITLGGYSMYFYAE